MQTSPIPVELQAPAKPNGQQAPSLHHERKCSKVAIVGFASSSRDLAPYHDPTWEIWGCNTLWHAIPRYDAWFDLHSPEVFRSAQFHPEHEAWLQKASVPLYMQRHEPDMPSSRALPRQAVIESVGLEYFTSSIAWMMGLALLMEYPVVGLWGIDMLGESEYAYQRACVEYLLGVMHGRKVNVHLPAQCVLLHGQHVYGYEQSFNLENFAIKKVQNRKRAILERRDEALQTLYRYDGAMAELHYWTTAPEGGGVPEWTPEATEERKRKLASDHAQVEKMCYTFDGQLQEATFWETQARHMSRGGA